ncbi:glycosyltransferase [Pedobacter frigiditerrae]|uniref:Glycosyltransferase n=1 Tax=Pedobacter frigiditerrae TaxID=2530452 RepID=A0A4R0N6E6_9SPHI|nr:glycosyltransferase family 4 protein [Pedobacter frigiditerrae]TCC94212.1 glycosyltransferase [Pedobacter frigiditerrae]
MKVLIIASEFPFPANHGAKVDIWNRILAFKKLNVEVFLVTWHPEKSTPSKENVDCVLRQVASLATFPLSSTLNRIIKLISFPSQVAARMLKKADYKSLLTKATQFNPDAIFIDSIYGGETGLRLAKDLAVPFSLRLHNVEHNYMWGQLKLAKGIRSKMSLLAMNIHLKSFEYNLISKADAFFDISIEDLAFWEKQNFKNGYWLPPIIDDTMGNLVTDVNKLTKFYHIAFIGNLYAPNNVSGLLWFINDVLPLINEKIPGLRFAVVGSNPVTEIIKACNNSEFIDLFTNVPDTNEYIQKSNVLINPVRFSSGVNIKAINMLSLDNPVVSTIYGVKGLPKEISQVFFIGNSPKEFSNHILEILALKKTSDLEKRKEMRKLFQVTALEKLLPKMLEKNIK